MEIIGLIDESASSKSGRKCSVSKLVSRVDCILSEQGFARGEKRIDGKTGESYIVYDGTEGRAVVRFTEDGDVIPLIIKGKVVAECPVYVGLEKVPKNVNYSIRKELRKI